jgi:O-antigen/teichoic acid export membrane protein
MVFAREIAEPAIRSMGLLTLGFGAFAIFGILTTALTSLQRERISALVTALAVLLVISLAFIFVRGRPFGVDLLWRMAIATSCGLVLATLAAGYFVYRTTGALVSHWCILRVATALATAIGIGRLSSPHGLLRTLVTAACIAIVYFVVLVVARELSRADWSRLTAIVRRRPA